MGLDTRALAGQIQAEMLRDEDLGIEPYHPTPPVPKPPVVPVPKVEPEDPRPAAKAKEPEAAPPVRQLEQHYRPSEIARRLGVGTVTVLRWIARGQLRSVQPFGWHLVPLSSVEQFLSISHPKKSPWPKGVRSNVKRTRGPD